MKLSNLTKVLGASALVLSLTLPATAQTGGGTGTGGSGTSGSGTSGTGYTDTRNDSPDWGWVGLLGLAGLAGLTGRRRNDDVRYRDPNETRTTTTNRY
jgi:MYXO-CTERM domain-containing protein